MQAPDREAEFDVLIAGGGLVGGSLAIALAQTPCRVGLVEAVPPDSHAQPSFDDRTIALSRGSQRILESLGLWPLLQNSVWPIERIHVSEQRRFGTAVIDAVGQGIPELGCVINSRLLGQALWQMLAQLPSVRTYCPAQAVLGDAIASEPGAWRTVRLHAGEQLQTLRTRLLVVADGARSPLRSALGIAADDRDYGQVAVVANIEVDARYVGHTAYERFTPAGPLAILPGRAGHYTMVLACGKDAAPAVMAMENAALLDHVQAAFGYRLGRFRQIGKRHAYPLSLVAADSIVTDRAVLIGNAAHGLHPIAGQGFNLGLRDVASLAELITDHCRGAPANIDPGRSDLLTAYAEWRQADQARVVSFTDGLIRLFGIDAAPVAIGRGLGLAAFDIAPGAKQELARQTMGLAGRLSRLARGRPL
jgi:2-octaprenyl-6-methoxyphenol hydroxylase